ncbi:MAG: regulator of sigma E protease [Flavobacteriaceae bacterium]|jgi:regulator of sigma E protease
MSIIILIVILAVLVLAHEWGHFIVAKKTGMRVDEFGIGLPPRACVLTKKNGTLFTLNWIPFGGFVKIYGEGVDGGDSKDKETSSHLPMNKKPRWMQALVLIAGIVMNILVAYVLFAFSFIGQQQLSHDTHTFDIEKTELITTFVAEDSPAGRAGIVPGDVITSVLVDGVDTKMSAEEFAYLPKEDGITFSYKNNIDESQTITLFPEELEGAEGLLIGVQTTYLDTVNLNIVDAFSYAVSFTSRVTVSVGQSFIALIGDAFSGNANMDALSGPVGIVGVIGDVSDNSGFSGLLFLAGIISLNLAILNLIPFPALDGGRLLVVLIESIMGKNLNSQVIGIYHTVGFALLILLMIFVTVNDIVKLF